MERQEKISLLHEWIGCFHPLTYWIFGPDRQQERCTSPDGVLLREYLIGEPALQALLDDCARSPRPLERTTERKTTWLAAAERADGRVLRIHVFGPFFQDNASRQQCGEQLNRLDLSPAMAEALWQAFRTAPLIFSSDFTRYAMLLHYCLTGEKGNAGEFSPQRLGAPQTTGQLQREQTETMVHQHELELKMIGMIREGNLNYRQYIREIMMRRSGPGVYAQETLRQTKNRTYARMGLVTEAAIQGGVDTEIALPLLYYHLQCMEDATTIQELARACSRMEEEFANLVYRRRTASLSQAVLDCCDYIQLHLEDENLTRAELAKTLNYSEGYLSRKFSQEMSMTIKDYITKRRLERSRELLRTTPLSVQDVSQRLCFGSPSHFAAAFKKAYGISPSRWREAPEMD